MAVAEQTIQQITRAQVAGLCKPYADLGPDCTEVFEVEQVRISTPTRTAVVKGRHVGLAWDFLGAEVTTERPGAQASVVLRATDEDCWPEYDYWAEAGFAVMQARGVADVTLAQGWRMWVDGVEITGEELS
ncbi:MAG: hypothetical protein ACE149_19795 [Armatimonadota bacterium]